MHTIASALHPTSNTLYPDTLHPTPSSPPCCFWMSSVYCWRPCLLCQGPAPYTLVPDTLHPTPPPMLLHDEFRVLLAALSAGPGPGPIPSFMLPQGYVELQVRRGGGGYFM